jgi:hypothetical protein
MSEVNKVNGVAIADIETINGVASADIESIDGVDFVTGFSNTYSISIGNNGGVPDYSYLKVANPTSYNFIADASGDGDKTAPYGDAPFSVSIWFQQDTFTASPFISQAVAGAGGAAIVRSIKIHGGKYVFAQLFDPSGYYIAIYDTTHDWSGLSSGWHHLVLSYYAPSGSAANTIGGEANRAGSEARRDSMFYYMDGVLYTGGSTAYPICYNSSPPAYAPCYTGLRTEAAATVNIGGMNPGQNSTFRGKLDEVSIWTKALTTANITDLYNSGTPTDISLSSSLKSWWRMGDNDGGTGTTVTDVMGVGDGTAYGAAGGGVGWSATSGFTASVPP